MPSILSYLKGGHCMTQEEIGFCAVCSRDGDPDVGRERHRGTADLKGGLERCQETLRDLCGVCSRGEIRQQSGELVSPRRASILVSAPANCVMVVPIERARWKRSVTSFRIWSPLRGPYMSLMR